MTYLLHDKRFKVGRKTATAISQVATIGLTLVAMIGCQTLSLSSLNTPHDAPLITASHEEKDEYEGSLGRALQERGATGRDSQTAAKTARLEADFASAKELLEADEYAAAELGFKRLVKQTSPKSNWFSGLRLFSKKERDKDTRPAGYDSIREESLYYLAESRFHQERYPEARDIYTTLMKDYPSSRFLEPSTRRIFTIARIWLGTPDFATTEDVQQVSMEGGVAEPQPIEEDSKGSFPLIPNFRDKSRPVFDTQGHAMEALKSIWLNDPTGPLADDALMMTASHFFKKGDHREADRYFEILREEYPKSPHLKAAFVLGSHVKLMSYQGPSYDGKQLEDAEKLKESTLRLFPELQERDRIKSELASIKDAKAQRDLDKALFYRRKGNWNAVAIYCNLILERYADTATADRARELLVEAQNAQIESARPRWYDKLTPDFLGKKKEGEVSEYKEPVGRIKL